MGVPPGPRRPVRRPRRHPPPSRGALRDAYDQFPWSSIESGHLDLDHTKPWQPGVAGQTSPDNLARLSRRAHRVKTLAGWRLERGPTADL